MADFMLLAEETRNRKAIIIPLLESLDQMDFSNTDCSDTIPFDMGLDQVPGNAIITPISVPPTFIFCPSNLPQDSAEFDHISILTVTSYSFFWVKSNNVLTTNLVYIGGVNNKNFLDQTKLRQGDSVIIPHLTSFAVVQETFAEIFKSIFSIFPLIQKQHSTSSATFTPSAEKQKEAPPHASTSQLKDFSKLSSARSWYDNEEYSKAFEGKDFVAGNLQLDKIVEHAHAGEIQSGPLNPDVNRLSLSKTIAVCCGIFNKADGVSISDFNHPSDGPVLTKSNVIDAIRNFILYSSHVHGRMMQRPLRLLEQNVIGINRNWRGLPYRVLILLVDDTLNKVRSVPYTDDEGLLSTQLTSVVSKLEWNNTEMFAFMISHKYSAPSNPALEASTDSSTDPTSVPPKKRVRFEEPCPMTADVCWNWVAQKKPCKTSTTCKFGHPHEYPIGTPESLKQALKAWVIKKNFSRSSS